MSLTASCGDACLQRRGLIAIGPWQQAAATPAYNGSMPCSKLRLRKFDEIEVREYEPYLIAEATVSGQPMRRAAGTGFMQVARCAPP